MIKKFVSYNYSWHKKKDKPEKLLGAPCWFGGRKQLICLFSRQLSQVFKQNTSQLRNKTSIIYLVEYSCFAWKKINISENFFVYTSSFDKMYTLKIHIEGNVFQQLWLQNISVNCSRKKPFHWQPHFNC